MANPSAEGYGNWDASSQQWRSWVKIEQTALTDKAATYKVSAWMCAKNGSSSYSTNIEAWAGIWDATNGYRWSSVAYVGNFDAGDEWCYKTQSWTVPRTHSSQYVYGYADVVAKSGIYSGRQSNNTGSYEVKLSLAAKTSYQVTFNANGGSGAPSAQTKWYDETLTLSSTAPTRSGYTFLGWATTNSATSAAYAAGASFTANAATTLYAVWRKAITLTFNANGGSGAPAAITQYAYNSATSSTFTVPSTTPTKSGYTFLGWATTNSATSANASYDPGDRPSLSSNVTLYAVWRKAITLTYNGNKPSAASGSVSGTPAAATQYAYNSATSSTFTVSSNRPTLGGYTFLGWAGSASATSADGAYDPGDSVTLSSSKTIYSVWRAAAPTLSNVRVWRSDASGAEADEGSCAAVYLKWSMSEAAAVSVTATVNGHSYTTSFASATGGTVDTGTSGASHPLVVTDAALDTDSSYTVTIAATANGNTTTVTATVPVAYFHIDLKAGGHGVGIGMPAPSGVLGVGIDAEFHGGISASGNVSVAGTLKKGGTNVSLEGHTHSQYFDNTTSRTKNTVLAAPGSANGAASFRALVAADLPTVTVAKGGTGASTASPHYMFAGPSSGSSAAAPSFRALVTSDLPAWDWTSLGNTTDTTNGMSINISGYGALCVVGYYSSTYWSSLFIKPSWLNASTYRDFYLGGWTRDTTKAFCASFKATTTKFIPYTSYVNGTARSMTWYVYGVR